MSSLPLSDVHGDIALKAWEREALPRDTYADTWAGAEAKLLSDDEMRQFVVDGYLQIDSGVSKATNEAIYRKMKYLAEFSNPGNNIMPNVPQVRNVILSPKVRGALTSILGPNYHEHPHRILHDLPPKALGGRTQPQNYHKDNQSPMARPTRHHPNWVMVLYYAQDTPKKVGPTGAMPGSQYDRLAGHMEADERGLGKYMEGKAGTCTIVHFDLVHRGNVNLHASRTRCMLKLVFQRTQPPTGPTWDCKSDKFTLPKKYLSPYNLLPVWCHMWDWLCGKTGEKAFESLSSLHGEFKKKSLGDWIKGMDADHSNSKRGGYTPTACAYWIAGHGGKEGITALVTAITEAKNPRDEWLIRDTVTYMLPASYALGAIGSPAVDSILKALETAAKGKLKECGTAFSMISDKKGGTVRIREAYGEKRWMSIDKTRGGSWAKGLIIMSSDARKAVKITLRPRGNNEFVLQFPDGTRLHENGLGDKKLRAIKGAGSTDAGQLDIWVRSNLIFALGEMGVGASHALEPLLDMLANEPCQKIARILTEVVGDIAAGVASAHKKEKKVSIDVVRKTARVLGSLISRPDNKHWLSEEHYRIFNPNDQIRISAATGLLKLREFATPAEKDLTIALADTCGYVQWLCIQTLIAIDTPQSLKVAIRALSSQWYDGTLTRDVTF
ncbi:hypothetical protein AAMO2058_000810000 [Amorphochlora amoebiformis]